MAFSSLPSPGSSNVGTTDSSSSDSDRPFRRCKRKRSLPLTPPMTIADPKGARSLDLAVHVLHTEATALSHATRLYQNDPVARAGMLKAVDCIVDVNEFCGKLLICGVGKSGYIGMKLVATMKSLGLKTSFLHAAEAMHGDLGDIRSTDAVLFITYSGKTPELLTLIQHIPKDVPILALTSHKEMEACPLLAERPGAILLPAPIHEAEQKSFGVSAPTTSTTVALAVGDMLALTAADKMHQEKAGSVFRRNHPGGAIGLTKMTSD